MSKVEKELNEIVEAILDKKTCKIYCIYDEFIGRKRYIEIYSMQSKINGIEIFVITFRNKNNKMYYYKIAFNYEKLLKLLEKCL